MISTYNRALEGGGNISRSSGRGVISTHERTLQDIEAPEQIHAQDWKRTASVITGCAIETLVFVACGLMVGFVACYYGASAFTSALIGVGASAGVAFGFNYYVRTLRP